MAYSDFLGENMKGETSRRNFLLAGIALPVAAPALLAQSPNQKKPSFTYRTLGKTGLKPTSVGYGCMITSDQSVIEKAVDLGVNFFDTARNYGNGNNERMVGAALGSKRKNLILATKSMARSKQEALQHIDTSLKEIGTDYVDIWHLHGKDNPAQITDDLLEAQQLAKQAGKVRFLGISTHNLNAIKDKLIEKAAHFDVVLTQYNFTMGSSLDASIEAVSKAGLGVIAMKTMAGGSRIGGRGGFGFGQQNPKQAEINKRAGAMLAALKWVLKNKNIAVTIPSITDMEQLEENIKASSEPFSDGDEKILMARLQEIRPLYCSMCNQCDGKCPKGMPVANVLRYLAYAEGYGEFQLGRENFLALPTEVRDIRCESCSECSIKCPNGVRVAQRLMRAQELFA
jgi:aryl-alcohol dehydrogenase-like predicted oxidoreductase